MLVNEFLRKLTLKMETGSSNIRDNRQIICTASTDLVENSHSLLWLRDDDYDNSYLALGYSSFDNTPDIETLKGRFVNVELSNDVREFASKNSQRLDKLTQALLGEMNISNMKFHHIIIHDVLSGNGHDNSPVGSDILGWFTVIFPDDVALTQEQKNGLEIYIRFLALLIRQGRDTRIRYVIEEVHQQIAKVQNINELVTETSTILKNISSMENFLMLSSGCDKTILSDSVSDGQLKALNESVDRTFRSLDNLSKGSTGIHAKKYNGFIASNEKKHEFHLNTDMESIIYIPIVEPGYQLGETSFISRDKAFTANKDEKDVVSHRIYLSDKQTRYFLANSISTTDLKVCEAAARAFQGHLTASIYESKFAKVSKYFQEEPIDKPINIKKFQKSIRENIYDCVGIQILEYERDSNGTRMVYASPEHGIKLPEKYLDKMEEMCDEFHKEKDKTHTHQNTTNGDSIRIGIDTKYISKDKPDRIYLEFHLYNDYDRSRVFVLETHKTEISKSDFRILRHLVSELYLFYQNHDSLNHRASHLAQMRHAIVAPLSAANKAAFKFKKLMQARKRTEKQWKVLRKRNDHWEQLDVAIDLGETAKLLSESARFVFDKIEHEQLNIKPYNLDKLIDDIYNTFESRKKREGFVLPRDFGTKESITKYGDRDLLYVAMLNLVDNAIKYSNVQASRKYYSNKPEYSRLENQHVIEIKIQLKGDHYRFSVTNVGPFIDPKARDTIFTAFVRDKQYHNLHQKHGTGIGLPAAEHILLAHSPIARPDLDSILLDDDKKLAVTTFWFDMPYKIGTKYTKKPTIRKKHARSN